MLYVIPLHEHTHKNVNLKPCHISLVGSKNLIQVHVFNKVTTVQCCRFPCSLHEVTTLLQPRSVDSFTGIQRKELEAVIIMKGK